MTITFKQCTVQEIQKALPNISMALNFSAMLCGSLSPWPDGCRWRRQPLDMEGGYEYTE